MRVKEFSGAVHSLLRTYDGHLMQRDAGRMEDQGRGFRYAALNLAALHAQFGHKYVKSSYNMYYVISYFLSVLRF